MKPLWQQILETHGEFTIVDLCKRTGWAYRNLHGAVMRLRREGRIEVVGADPRGKNTHALVYRVVPGVERAARRRRARSCRTQAMIARARRENA